MLPANFSKSIFIKSNINKIDLAMWQFIKGVDSCEMWEYINIIVGSQIITQTQVGKDMGPISPVQ